MPLVRAFLVLLLSLAVLPAEEPALVEVEVEAEAPRGGEQLWGGLFWGGPGEYAGDPDASEPPAVVVRALRENHATTAPHYALLGHDEVELPAEWFTWVRFSEEFFLRVERAGRGESGGLVVDVQFWQQDQLLLSTSVTLTPERPLVIRGPAWRGGHLMATLLVEE